MMIIIIIVRSCQCNSYRGGGRILGPRIFEHRPLTLAEHFRKDVFKHAYNFSIGERSLLLFELKIVLQLTENQLF